ncbi:MAG: UvrD-helicase domain-containing protein [Fibrobacteraceae bacterium]|nr:UvrD-helicase domain-containing protein [Fibrobacteraceae bacterium]
MNDLKPFDIKTFDTEKDAFIEASAGTGKTYTIQRIVAKIIGSGKAHLPSVLLVTYTDKAAGELRDRIRKILEKGIEDSELIDEIFEKTSEEEKLRIKGCFYQAVQSIDLASIYTIHSFCERVIKSSAFEANAALSLAQTSEETVRSIVEKRCRDVWALDENAQFILLMAGANSVMDKVARIAGSYIPETIDLAELEVNSLYFKNRMELQTFFMAKGVQKKESAPFRRNFEKIKAYAEKNKDGKIKEFIDILELWDGVSPLYDGRSYSKRFFGKYPELSPEFDFFVDCNEGFENLKNSIIQNFEISEAKVVYEAWQKSKRENKEQTFNDMILNVYRNVIAKGSALCKEIQSRYAYAIIDEFQDTNNLQWEIFRTAFLNSKANHIYVVGDPKQSIYAFQGANLNVYRKAIGEIKTGFRLACNHRSSDGVIKACDAVFEQAAYAEENSKDFGDAFVPSECPKENEKIAALNSSSFPPVWLAPESTSPFDFAKFAVSRLAEIFEIKEGKTALQIWDPHENALRNLRYSDVAVLARTRTEMPWIERELAKAGVPVLRYKDNSLFTDAECSHWIALLRAIGTEDNSAGNQVAIRAALLTLFVHPDYRNGLSKLDFAEKFSFEDERAPFLTMLAHWRILACKKAWAELFEAIYSDSKIEETLGGSDNMQSLAKIRQIGDYIVNVLYARSYSLEEMVTLLENLHTANADADEDGEIVAKGTDLPAVQVMTIHASKGLEFPVVVLAGGYKGINNHGYSICLEDLEEEISAGALPKRRIAFQRTDKIAVAEEAEWRRLFYVALTRAEYLLVLPRYEAKKKSPSSFLAPTMNAMERRGLGNFLFAGKPEDGFFPGTFFAGVFSKYAESLSQRYSTESATFDIDEILKSKFGQINNHTLCLRSTSYSQIAHSAIKDTDSEDGNFYHEDAESDIQTVERIEDLVDGFPSQIKSKNFPKGKELGEAMHGIFENADFVRMGNMSLEDLQKDKDLCDLVTDNFETNGFSLKKHKDWLEDAIGIVHRTLRARFVDAKNGGFSLKDISSEDRKAEMLFQINGSERWVGKGYIDLAFRRKGKGGEDLFYILDWKSDSMNSYSPRNLEEEITKMHYDVQRVFYSRFMIQWIKGFYPAASEQEIFEKYFGGIYYVFFRGCKEASDAGIYSKQFEAYAEIKSQYEALIQRPMESDLKGK